MAVNENYKFKIILLGESGVGKTSTTHVYTNITFNSNHSVVNLTSKELLIEGKQVLLHMWETSSQKFFKNVAPNYYDGVLLVYDTTDRRSFEALSDWLTLTREKCTGAVLLLVGNKMDDSISAAVSRDEALRFTRDEELDVMEFCARNKDSVVKVFERLTLKILQTKSLIPREDDESSTSLLLPVHDRVDEHELSTQQPPDTPSVPSVQSQNDESEVITEHPDGMNPSHDETSLQRTISGRNGNLNTPCSGESDDELELSFVWVSFLPPIVKLPPDVTPLQVGRRRTSADSVLSMMTESEQIAFRLGAGEGRNNETSERRR